MSKIRIAVVKTPNGIKEFTFENYFTQRKHVKAWKKGGLKVVTGKYDTVKDSPDEAFRKLKVKLREISQFSKHTKNLNSFKFN